MHKYYDENYRFKREADAENFIEEEKLNDLLLRRRLVKTKACKETVSVVLKKYIFKDI